MNTNEKLLADMKAAMKAGEKLRLSTIRQLRSQLKDAQIAKGEELDEDESMAALNNAAKKRREAISMYQKGGRDDLVAVEQAELDIIETYLPKPLSAQALSDLVHEAVSATGAQGMTDFGKVMGYIMGKAKGRVDGKRVQGQVRELLQK